MKKIILLSCLFLFPLAHGGVFVEPYLGHSFTVDNEGKEIMELDHSSPFLGVRGGFSMLYLWAGGDISFQKGDMDIKTGNRDLERDFRRLDLAVVAGADFPVLCRFWAKYIFKSKFEIEEDSVENAKGYGLGVGFTGLPLVSINIEYISLSWDKHKNHRGVVHTWSKDVGISELLLSLSIPFEF